MRKVHTTMGNEKRTEGKARDENEVQNTTSDRQQQLGIQGHSLSPQQNKMKEGYIEEGKTFQNRNRQGQTS